MSLLTLITLGIALLPTIVIMLVVINNARAEKEPFKKLASVFTISALSTIPAIILEVVGGMVLGFVLGIFDIENGASTNESVIYQVLEFFVVVGLFEEACKYFTFKWIIFNDRDFDNTYDGVIYGACSALGFATLENLGYIFLNGGGLSVAIMRAVLSIPMHAVTGIVMGYHFGVTKYRRYNNLQDTHPERKAFMFSVILHGIYDSLATLPGLLNENWPFLVLLFVMVFIYVTIGKTVKRAKAESHNIYNRYYYEVLGGEYQDMKGGKTTSKKVFGMPLPPMGAARQEFNPYQPYQNGAPMGMPPMGMPPSMTNDMGLNMGQQPNYGQPQQGYQQPVQQPVYTGAERYSSQPRSPVQPAQSPVQPRVVAVSAVRAAEPAPTPSKYCAHCGASMPAEARFCPICGSKG